MSPNSERASASASARTLVSQGYRVKALKVLSSAVQAAGVRLGLCGRGPANQGLAAPTCSKKSSKLSPRPAPRARGWMQKAVSSAH